MRTERFVLVLFLVFSIPFTFTEILYGNDSNSAAIFDAENDCIGGEIYDNATFESGLGYFDVESGTIVQKFTPASYPFKYNKICIALTNTEDDADLEFNLVIYKADGDQGKPGFLLSSIPSIANSIPDWPECSFFSFDISSDSPIILAGSVYIGINWNSMLEDGFAICKDDIESNETDVFSMSSLLAEWFQNTPATLSLRAEGEAVQAIPTITFWGTISLFLLFITTTTLYLRKNTRAIISH
jgi:hypothetical protein